MPKTDDDLIDTLALRQLGLVTREQMLELGMSSGAIGARVRAQRLRVLHRGVYRVGPLVVPYARELAAVLACGPNAFLSHRSAGFLWQLLPDPGEKHPVDVSVSEGDRGRRPTIRARRVVLCSGDVTTRENIPVTTVLRTILDLAAVLDRRDLERVLALAERLFHLDQDGLRPLLDGNVRRPGAVLLRSLVTSDSAPAFTRSEAEARFLALIRKAQLPEPETNVQFAGYEVDFLWRRERAVVEVDGFAFHTSRRTFENDRSRDAWFTASGLNVLRVTWRQVVSEPEALVARLALTLARNAGLPADSSGDALLPKISPPAYYGTDANRRGRK